MGVPENEQFLGTLNAGHPGGMLPLTAAEKDTLHAPVLTIMALAKRIAGIV